MTEAYLTKGILSSGQVSETVVRTCPSLKLKRYKTMSQEAVMQDYILRGLEQASQWREKNDTDKHSKACFQ